MGGGIFQFHHIIGDGELVRAAAAVDGQGIVATAAIHRHTRITRSDKCQLNRIVRSCSGNLHIG